MRTQPDARTVPWFRDEILALMRTADAGNLAACAGGGSDALMFRRGFITALCALSAGMDLGYQPLGLTPTVRRPAEVILRPSYQEAS